MLDYAEIIIKITICVFNNVHHVMRVTKNYNTQSNLGRNSGTAQHDKIWWECFYTTISPPPVYPNVAKNC